MSEGMTLVLDSRVILVAIVVGPVVGVVCSPEMHLSVEGVTILTEQLLDNMNPAIKVLLNVVFRAFDDALRLSS